MSSNGKIHRKSLVVNVLEAKGLNIKSATTDKPQVYCVVSVNNVHFNTTSSDKVQKPDWKQKFTFNESAIQPKDAQLRVIVFSKQGTKETVVGESDVMLSNLAPNSPMKDWQILSVKGEEKSKAKILLEITLVTDTPSGSKRKNRMAESLTRKISWGAKQTSSQIVSSQKKPDIDSSDPDDDVDVAASPKADGDVLVSPSATSPRNRRLSAFDYVGSGTEVESFEDQFKQAMYQDETDMEDAFATDDSKVIGAPLNYDSDPDVEADDPPASDIIANIQDNSDVPDSDAPPAEKKKKKKKKKTTKELSTMDVLVEEEEDSGKEVSPTKDVEKSSANKEVEKTNEKANEKANIDKTVTATSSTAATSSTNATQSNNEHTETEHNDTSITETPKKKSTFKRFIARKISIFTSPKPKRDHTEVEHTSQTSTEVKEPTKDAKENSKDPKESSTRTPRDNVVIPVIVNTAGSTSEPESDHSSPKSARKSSSKSLLGFGKIKHEDPLKMELRSYVMMEKAYLQDLTVLVEEYLQPAKKAPTIEEISSLLPHVEKMISAHAATLKVVEKKLKDDQFAHGTTFDDLLANVSDAYKSYRGKQVLLLSILDRSPTEKATADHVTISNWLQSRIQIQEQNNKKVASLQELILAPMHRLANLAFVLEKLIDVTPYNHYDLPSLRKAAGRVQLLNSDLSSRGSSFRTMEKLREIDAMLEFPGGSPAFYVANESEKRHYLLEGQMTQLEEQAGIGQFHPVYLFLFSDMAILCKKLATDTLAVPSSSSTRVPTTPRATGGATTPRMGSSTPRGNNSSNGNVSPRAANNSSVNPSPSPGTSSNTTMLNPSIKYIVLSRIKLDRVFLVDPEDIHGEMSAYSGVDDPSKAPSTSSEPSDLRDLDRLLEIVEMGVAIHRIRFYSKDDKKLWKDIFENALNSVKRSFNYNERQYLYKLLVTKEIPPISGAYPDSNELALWPHSRSLANLASRQLLERMHSTNFNKAKIHQTSKGSATEGEMAVVKQEVAFLKRDFARQLEEANLKYEIAQAEIHNLKQAVHERDAALRAAENVSESDTKQSKSRKGKHKAAVVNDDDSVSSSGKDAVKLSRKKRLALAEARAEEYMNKFMDLATSLSIRDQKESDMMLKLSETETLLNNHRMQTATIIAGLQNTIEQYIAEMSATRKQFALLLQQQQQQSQSSPGAPRPTIPPKLKIAAEGPGWRGSAPHLPAVRTRPSSTNLSISALVGRDGLLPDAAVGVANSADSSESSNSQSTNSPAPGKFAIVQQQAPNNNPPAFGSGGQSPSRLNLLAAQTANAANPANQPPVSPNAKPKERKLKNVKFPAGAEENKSWTDRARKKLGLSGPKPKRDEPGTSPTPWRKAPIASGSDSGTTPVQIKTTKKIDWNSARTEAYFSDDIGSDYDPAMHLSPSDFERLQETAADVEADNSDYSQEE